ncbi:MAG: transglutaminase domain-containing protein, partial [Actinobacteria bacterium]|nr:transglutaminase domain-containing protein [Actinomycetota bacterium]
MTDPHDRPDRLPLAASEVALLGVHLAVVVGFARLYEGWSFLGDLVAFTLAAHLLATVTRRRRVPAPITVAVALGGAALVGTWLLFPDSSRFGLPTAQTWDLAREALREARTRFEEVAAPAPVLPGFQLASGLALWWAVWFGDWAAFRLRATAEAVAPASVLFVFGALLGSGDHQLLAATTFAAAVVAFVAAHRALRAQVDQHWLAPSPAAGPRAVLRAGAGLAVVGVVAGVLVGPRLPGTGEEPLVQWRDRSGAGGDRTTVSPIVDLRKRLVDQSDTELFTVRTNERAYQRLTALDRFDGQLWSSGGQFSPADGRLPAEGPGAGTGPRITQEIEIEALSAIWAPVAFEARSLEDSSSDLRWDPASSTLIVDRSEPTSDGLSYRVVSQAPATAVAALEAAGTRDPPEISQRYEQLPAGFPEVATRTAREVTATAGSRYAKAVALQDWFRETFRYSLDVPPGHGDDALVAFLASKEGYCEQFAGTYAAMA